MQKPSKGLPALSTAPHLSPTTSTHLSNTDTCQTSACAAPLLAMCFLALPVPPSKADLQPGSERELLVFSSASGMELGAPQGLGRVLAAWCHTWSLLKPAGRREDLGHAPQGPEEQRLSPLPPHPPDNQSGQGKRWSSSKLLKPRLREQKPGPHPPANTHTPFFQGAWHPHPKDEPGSVLSSKQPLEPLSPPFRGLHLGYHSEQGPP